MAGRKVVVNHCGRHVLLLFRRFLVHSKSIPQSGKTAAEKYTLFPAQRSEETQIGIQNTSGFRRHQAEERTDCLAVAFTGKDNRLAIRRDREVALQLSREMAGAAFRRRQADTRSFANERSVPSPGPEDEITRRQQADIVDNPELHDVVTVT